VGTCPEWICDSLFLFIDMKSNIDSIFYVLGNKARRDILLTLSNEPMYFNQVSKQIGIGQQAMLRHLQALVDTGFVNTYGEKSKLGAPDRKYYRLNSSFNLSISLSEDEFTINYEEKTHDTKSQKLFDTRCKQISSDPCLALGSLMDNLAEMDVEIEKLHGKINDLKVTRQIILHKIHQIGQENFSDMERRIVYTVMRKTPSSLAELSKTLGENKSDVKSVLKDLQNKMDGGKIKDLVDEIIT
jgi:ArsR family transcriptional regulator